MTLKKIEKQIFCACKDGDLDKIKYLIMNGVNIHANDDEALSLSVFYEHLDIVKFLIENGANVHTKNDDALRLATLNGNLEMIRYLIEIGGANLHVGNDYVLHWSAFNGNLEVLQYLFSLYEDKKKAFEIVLKNLHPNDLYIAKDIIEQYNIEVEDEVLESIKNKLPNIYRYIKISNEIKSTQNNIDFNI